MLQRAALVLLMLITPVAFGQTRYVTDDIRIELRTGPSLENRIKRYLSSGERVEVIGADEDAGYTQVRLASDGDTGWVLTRYLIAEPIARDRLTAAERNLTAARNRVSELEAEIAGLTEDLGQTRAELDAVRSQHKDVSVELQDIRNASANAIALRDQNEELRRRIADAEQRINRLAMENTELVSDSRQNWFLVGAGVLFAGIIIGLIAPSLRRKRRSSW